MTPPPNSPSSRTIIISDREHGLPYSKGLMANQIMAAGLSPVRAYHVAQAIEDRLLASGQLSVTTIEVRRLAAEAIREEAGERYADVYLRWQTVADIDRPIIVLLGGGTGAGKSTIATQLAARLGIVRIVSTDAIREVMKGVVARRFMPTLYTSSFNADEVVKGRLPAGEDAVLVGFREQAAAVAAGIRALVERAMMEGTGMIIEGAHVVPGFIETSDLSDRAVVVQLTIVVEDEDLHRSHFTVRGDHARARPQHRYLAHFDNIRRIQKFIRSQSLAHNVPVVSNYNLDSTLARVIDLVVTTATQTVSEAKPPRPRGPVAPPVARTPRRDVSQDASATVPSKGVATP